MIAFDRQTSFTGGVQIFIGFCLWFLVVSTLTIFLRGTHHAQGEAMRYSVLLSPQLSETQYQDIFLLLQDTPAAHAIKPISAEKIWNFLKTHLGTVTIPDISSLSELPFALEFSFNSSDPTAATLLSQLASQPGVQQLITPTTTDIWNQPFFLGSLLLAIMSLLITTVLFFLISQLVKVMLITHHRETQLLQTHGIATKQLHTLFLRKSLKLWGIPMLVAWVLWSFLWQGRSLLSDNIAFFQKIVVFYHLSDLLILIGLTSLLYGVGTYLMVNSCWHQYMEGDNAFTS